MWYMVLKRLNYGNRNEEKRAITMCTAATYKTTDFYFGRTLDYEFSYGDEVAVLPRNYALTFPAYGCIKSALCDHRYGICSGRLSTVL